MYELLQRGHEHGIQPWSRLLDEGHGGALWRADAQYVEARRSLWTAALS
jgi:hypothetical protein